MKKWTFFTGLFVSAAVSAAVPVDGWYASAFGGYAYIPNHLSLSRYNYWGAYYLGRADYDSGYTAGARLGYKSLPLRYEGELTFMSADLNKISRDFIRYPANGAVHAAALMGNVYYDIPCPSLSLSPFFGVGLGYAWIKNNFETYHPYYSFGYGAFGYDPLVYAVDYSTSSVNFAYQVTGGIAYHFAENFSIDGAYRYFATERVHQLGKPFQANLATLGVTYRFDGVAGGIYK